VATLIFAPGWPWRAWTEGGRRLLNPGAMLLTGVALVSVRNQVSSMIPPTPSPFSATRSSAIDATMQSALRDRFRLLVDEHASQIEANEAKICVALIRLWRTRQARQAAQDGRSVLIGRAACSVLAFGLCVSSAAFAKDSAHIVCSGIAAFDYRGNPEKIGMFIYFLDVRVEGGKARKYTLFQSVKPSFFRDR